MTHNTQTTIIPTTLIQTTNGKIAIQSWLPTNAQHQTPIFLLHDSLGSIAQWRDFPAQLAQSLSRPVIAYDRLGFGQSDAHPNPPSFDFIVEQAKSEFPQIKAALGISEYYLLGHSVGGTMSVNIAATDRQCQGIITLAAQAFVEERTLDGIKAAQKAFSNPEQFKKLEKWHGEKTRWVLDAWITIWLDPAFADWSLAYCIKDVRCKVLAIHGELDDFGSEAFPRYIAEQIAKHSSAPAKAMILTQCGHIPHKERTEQVLEAVKAFI